jgi:hypothetical protein
MQSSGVDDKYVEELFEAELEDNTETGSENINNKNLEEKGEQVDNKEDEKKSDKTRDRDSTQENRR